jgi:hypothetical protein
VEGEEQPIRSLEKKWDAIQYDVAKFVGVHNQVVSMRESGISPNNVLERALELYKMKHPKQRSLVFIHCCLYPEGRTPLGGDERGVPPSVASNKDASPIDAKAEGTPICGVEWRCGAWRMGVRD